VPWLAQHLAEYGADPSGLYVAGHSAGGHLTAMTMPLAEVRGGIAISGIYDLEPIRLNYLNEKLGLDMAKAERNSPVRHLPATAGELVVAYGTRGIAQIVPPVDRVWPGVDPGVQTRPIFAQKADFRDFAIEGLLSITSVSNRQCPYLNVAVRNPSRSAITWTNTGFR
jgi:hypothetical protein